MVPEKVQCIDATNADGAPNGLFGGTGAIQRSSDHVVSAVPPALAQVPSSPPSIMSQPSPAQLPSSPPPMISQPAPRSVTSREAPASETSFACGVSEDVGFPAPGCRVRIQGVKTQSLQALNGQIGTVIMHDETSDTWKVRLDGGSKKLFKTFHLTPYQGEDPTRGAIAEVQPIHPEKQPMVAATEENTISSAAPAATDEETAQVVIECAITSGTRICVFGLRSRPELNGKLGIVQTNAADAKNRWKVRMDDGEKILLGHVNFEVIAEKS